MEGILHVEANSLCANSLLVPPISRKMNFSTLAAFVTLSDLYA